MHLRYYIRTPITSVDNFKMGAVMFAILMLAMLSTVTGHANYLTSSHCSRSLTVGTAIMTGGALADTTRSITVTRGETSLTSGGTYVPGESLTVHISSTSGEYVFETTKGSFTGGGCTGKRFANGAGELVMPAAGSGSVTIIGGWAPSQTKVRIMASFTLNEGAVVTAAPSIAPSVNPTHDPTMGPTETPTTIPTMTPTAAPTETPSEVPTTIPTTFAPSLGPTESPTLSPTTDPTAAPTTFLPTATPTMPPTVTPTTLTPSLTPTANPTLSPTEFPTASPSTVAPSASPTAVPTAVPSATPTLEPSLVPTLSPTIVPTQSPTTSPSTITPTGTPTLLPTAMPTTFAPSLLPTTDPTILPTVAPTLTPTSPPTAAPSAAPTDSPTMTPTLSPTTPPSATPTTAVPSMTPTADPTFLPGAPTPNPTTGTPTVFPTETPTATPTTFPTMQPTASRTESPSDTPTMAPTVLPTATPSTATPSTGPTTTPTCDPSLAPTHHPSVAPTMTPTVKPTTEPTLVPTESPTVALTTIAPTTNPSEDPTAAPSTNPSQDPSLSPTLAPTESPTAVPSGGPTLSPTAPPSTFAPSAKPSEEPTIGPTLSPSVGPSTVPTAIPTLFPTGSPTIPPSGSPTATPSTSSPSVVPTPHPSIVPSVTPTNAPTNIPTTAAPTFISTATPTTEPTLGTPEPSSAVLTLVSLQTVQVLSNLDASDIEGNTAARRALEGTLKQVLVQSMSSFARPKYVNITGVLPYTEPAGRLRQLTAAEPKVEVTYLISYNLEGTQYSSPHELEGSVNIALSVVMDSQLFVVSLQAYNIPSLAGITSSQLISTSVGEVAVVRTPQPSREPTVEVAATATVTDDDAYEGRVGAKLAIGLLVGGACLLLVRYIAVRLPAASEESLSPIARIATKIPIVVALATTVVAIGLVFAWATESTGERDTGYLSKPSWSKNVFTYHPIFMVLFFAAQVQAISNWSLFSVKFTAKTAHVLVQLCALGTMIFALIAVVKFTLDNRSPSLVSMHAWIGVAAVAVFCVNFLWGGTMSYLTIYHPDSKLRSRLHPLLVHKFLGAAALFLSAVAINTGIMDQLPRGACSYTLGDGASHRKDYDPAENYQYIPGSCKIANGLGVAVLIAAMSTVLVIFVRVVSGNDRRLRTVAPRVQQVRVAAIERDAGGQRSEDGESVPPYDMPGL